MRGAQLRRIASRYPAAVIAARVGRKLATVKRWIKAGESPPAFDAALRSLSGVRPPTVADTRRALRVYSAEELARLATGKETPSKADVSRARKWKQTKLLPLEARGFLFEQAPEPVPAEATIRGIKHVSSGRNWDLITVEFDLRSEMLTIPSLVLVLAKIQEAFQAHKVAGARYQAAVTGESALSRSDVTWTDKSPDDSTVLVNLPDGTGLLRITTWGGSYSSLAQAMSSIKQKMAPKYQFSFRLIQALAMIRIRRR